MFGRFDSKPQFFVHPVRESNFAIVLGIWNKTKYDFHIQGLFELAIPLLPFREQGIHVQVTLMSESN